MEDQKERKLSKSYYLKPEKIIRDLVHGYINLTRFDLKLIDTVPFQRLSDIRQLTCQHVYPAARHTRFEHSLGVQELMRNAIKYINRNGVIGGPPRPDSERIISEALEFNACVAALLHDVGHCPFSHMGETEFDKQAVQKELVSTVKNHPQLRSCTDLIKALGKDKGVGAVHEQLSCIVILNEYSDKLLNLTEVVENDLDSCEIKTDFELIIRSILGIEYDVSTEDESNDHKIKNIIVRLLNSKIIDVDKLDYIIRDSYLTGIGTPAIDTQRLFRNMYLDKSYSLVFTSRAVPALQNMIDARDGLYLYVYNHHVVVYSDFLNTYISRRLHHNAKAFYRAVYPDIEEQELEDCLQQCPPIFSMGIVPKSYFFSVDTVEKKHYSDSAWLSLLNDIHINYQGILEVVGCRGDLENISDEARLKAQKEIQARLCEKLKCLNLKRLTVKQSDNKSKTYNPIKKLPVDAEKALAERIYTSMQLVHQSMQRYYLKPWWKTVFEFSNFMDHYFRDDLVREQAGKFICNGGVHKFVYKGKEYKLEADEFRSQIAKYVIYITQRLIKDKKDKQLGLLEELNDGDFFVIQRSPRFFASDAIEKIEIALKSNEILGPPADVSRQVYEYYIKKLTNIIPQKDYSSIYAKEGFYIFSKRISNMRQGEEGKSRHYELLERIFAFVVKEFVDKGEFEFIKLFQDRTIPNVEAVKQKMQAKEYMYTKFAEKFISSNG